ncbi:MAG: peptidylprolyl isomerase [Deltaproteobacteria bacterium]|jgi:peptidyl-prolyl cis-trans isomerase B (cyclophilin B)|nr:peptidylprolyl isomerase [Deltaproteobacteria bacterium]
MEKLLFNFIVGIWLWLGICSLALAELAGRESQNSQNLPFAVNNEEIAKAPLFALIKTTQGYFEIRFFKEDAPVHVLNFQYLAKQGFYDNLMFYRYFPGYLIQGGDPNNNGTGGTGYIIEPEFSSLKHKRGIVAMSRIRGSKNPGRESNGSQFYIALGNAPQLDGLYSIFAEVVNGLDVVEKLRVGDKILEIKLSQ